MLDEPSIDTQIAGVTRGASSRDWLFAAKPDYLIEAMEDLLCLVEREAEAEAEETAKGA